VTGVEVGQEVVTGVEVGQEVVTGVEGSGVEEVEVVAELPEPKRFENYQLKQVKAPAQKPVMIQIKNHQK
jgi:hypothetical protein